MLRGDAEHGRAKASGVVEGVTLLAFRRELLAHTVDQMDFCAHSERGPLRADSYPPMCTIVLDAGTKSGSPM
jgi:hypothetical protein